MEPRSKAGLFAVWMGLAACETSNSKCVSQWAAATPLKVCPTSRLGNKVILMDSPAFVPRTSWARSSVEGTCAAARTNAGTKDLDMDASAGELLVKAYLYCNNAILARGVTTPPLALAPDSGLMLSMALPILLPERDLVNGALSNMQNPGLPFHADRLVFVRIIGQHRYGRSSKTSPCGRPRSTWPNFTFRKPLPRQGGFGPPDNASSHLRSAERVYHNDTVV